jgi:hypothetical protein
MKTLRFSKAALAAYIRGYIDRCEFDSGNGYAQVEGKGEALNRMYGRYRAFLDLAYEFKLDLYPERKPQPTPRPRPSNDQTEGYQKAIRSR